MKKRVSIPTASARLLCTALLVAFAQCALLSTPVAAQPTASSAVSADREVARIADQYYLLQAKFDPLGATGQGDNRFDDQLGMDIDPVKRAEHFAQLRNIQTGLRAVGAASLSAGARLNFDLLDYELTAELNSARFPGYLLPINQMNSVPVTLANYASGKGSQPLTNPAQYRAYLNRLTALPTWIDLAIANMRSGMARGVVLPRALVVSALPQFRKLVSATPEESVYYTPIKNLPATFSDDDKRSLTLAYRSLIAQRLTPSLRRLADFLENDYLPAARATSGIGALPDGPAWYLAAVARSTTTTLTPDQVHATGLAEVARIQAQYAILAPKLGYTGELAGFPTWVDAQDRFRPYHSEQEILEVYRQLKAVLDVRLPALFSTLPKSALEIQPEPELTRLTASDHYTPPAADGSRPGVFWAVVNDPRQYSRVGMTTLFLHEGVPGHHFQIARTIEMPLPDFRKFGGHTAYIEGWALYAETLGNDMHLFDDPAAYFGHLNDEMLRAVRLVVDTGLHAKGWSRERAIQYMRETLGYNEALAKSEVERYMAWPGQALGYKIGSLKIVELRQRARTALGPKFSMAAFHEVVLDSGSLPLTVLEAKVDRWIAATR